MSTKDVTFTQRRKPDAPVRATQHNRQLVITVHGIRTFGKWQERLKHLLSERNGGNHDQPNIEVLNYKFGYFSVIAFILPFTRWLVTHRFRKKLIHTIERRRLGPHLHCGA